MLGDTSNMLLDVDEGKLEEVSTVGAVESAFAGILRPLFVVAHNARLQTRSRTIETSGDSLKSWPPKLYATLLAQVWYL